jgi:hypothetical protein
LQIIDNTDIAVTSNITKIRIRRDLQASINQFAQYELCFGNKFHFKSDGYNIKSTGFHISIDPDTVYLTDTPYKNANGDLDGSGKGIISIVKPLSERIDKTKGIKQGHTHVPFGKYLLNRNRLDEDIVSFKHDKGYGVKGYPSKRVSKNLSNIL